MKCTLCDNDFPLLQDGGSCIKCGKCFLRKPGLSVEDLEILNKKPQCAACGLVSLSLQYALCKACITVYQKKDAIIPSFILRLPAMANILLHYSNEAEMDTPVTGLVSESAAMLMQSAARFQSRASESRISTQPSGVPNMKFAGSGSGTAVFKARSIKAEKQKKREVFKNKDTSITVAATVWMLDDNQKMLPINSIRVTCVVGTVSFETSKTAIGEALTKVGALFQREFPFAQPLTWSNVRVYAHESGSKFSSLDPPNDEETIHEYYIKQFLTPGLTNETMQKTRKIEIRFAFRAAEVFPDNMGEMPFMGLKSSRNGQTQSALQSKRGKRAMSMQSSHATTSVQAFNKYPKSAFLPPTNTFSPLHSMGPPPVPQTLTQPPVLRSAFIPQSASATSQSTRPTQLWTCSCEMITIIFYHTSASYSGQTGLLVDFTVDKNILETMDIAKKHETSEDVGYIGKGYTKKGIYARFKGREYVLTQPIDETMSDISVQSILRAEYALLCIGDLFKREFDKYAVECDVTTIPKFYFNFNDSILGTIDDDSFGEGLPFRHFIATPLLPCGRLDVPIKKFTGNGELGEANDHMTSAIHAFAHFSVVYSQKNILFCDLQGAPDKKGVMCLIDPQAHTVRENSVQPAYNNCWEYWDKGSKGIDEFLEQHSKHCQKNWVCRKLRLDEVVIVPASPQKDKAVHLLSDSPPRLQSSRSGSKKLKVSYLVDSD